MKKLWFVTGTDTNVGKTLSCILLLKLAMKKGFYTAGYKPIASGRNSHITNRNHDAMLLKKNSSVNLSYKEVNPFLFNEPVCPYFLTPSQNNFISEKKLSLGLLNLKKKSNWIIVEGIGGWCTPISRNIILSEWVKKENLKVILVVGIKLGCINHAILTQNAIIQSRVSFVGWIANFTLPKNQYDLKHIAILKKYLKSKFLGYIKYQSNLDALYTLPSTIKLPTDKL